MVLEVYIEIGSSGDFGKPLFPLLPLGEGAGMRQNVQ